MIDREGRVRVMDFGLARGAAADGEASTERSARELERSDLGIERSDLGVSVSVDSHLTRTGAMLGTPVYMAPEQHEGRTSDARSDLFAYCVALYQGLYGERPFSGETIAVLLVNSQRGAIRPPPAGSRVPGWLRKIVVRGLQPDPDDRYPSMDALLVDLTRDRGGLRRWGLLLGAGAVIAGVTAALVAGGEGCDDGAAAWEAAWGSEARAAIAGSIDAAGDAGAARLLANVDEYVAAWREGHREACAATRERGELSEELLDRRMACLDRQRRGVARFLAGIDRAGLDRAIDASYRLPDVGVCADVDALVNEAPLPADPAARRRIEELRAKISEAWMLRELGQQRESAEQLRGIVDELRGLDYGPALSEALMNLGDAERELGEVDAALAHFDEAARLAAVAHERARLVQIFGARAFLVGVFQGRHEAGDAWLDAAELLQEPGDPPRRAVSLLVSRALLASARKDPTAARDLLARALAVAEEKLGPDHPVVGKVVGNLGGIEEGLGNYDAAAADLERAVAITRDKLGPRHTDLGHHLLSLGNLAEARGEYDKAIEYTAESLAIRRERLGERHIDVARALSNLGHLKALVGRFDDAAALLREAQAIQGELFGPDHPDFVETHLVVGEIALGQGHLDDAEASFRRSVAQAEVSYGPASPAALGGRFGLAEVARERGRVDEAHAGYDAILGDLERLLGPESGDLLGPLDGLVRTELARAPATALAHAERMVAIDVSRPTGPIPRATAKLRLAQALLAAKAPAARSEARTLVDELLAGALPGVEGAKLKDEATALRGKL